MMALNRRTLLRGMAASVALPYLEAMSPARTSAAEAPKRFIALFQPNGVYPPAWDVRGSGASYEFSPILEPLRVHRGDIQIITNLGTNAKGHVAATSAVLTGTPLQVTANDPAFVPRMGISIDQLLAQKLGQSTRIASLELGTEPPRAGGENDRQNHLRRIFIPRRRRAGDERTGESSATRLDQGHHGPAQRGQAVG